MTKFDKKFKAIIKIKGKKIQKRKIVESSWGELFFVKLVSYKYKVSWMYRVSQKKRELVEFPSHTKHSFSPEIQLICI